MAVEKSDLSDSRTCSATQLFGSFAHFLQLPRGVVNLGFIPPHTVQQQICFPDSDVSKAKSKCLGGWPQLIDVVQKKVAASIQSYGGLQLLDTSEEAVIVDVKDHEGATEALKVLACEAWQLADPCVRNQVWEAECQRGSV